jgi:hypothetical protein
MRKNRAWTWSSRSAWGLVSLVLVGCGAEPGSAEPGSAEAGESVDLSLQALAAEGYVTTPGGLVHRSCMYELAEDEHVDDHRAIVGPDGSVRRQMAPCQYPRKAIPALQAQSELDPVQPPADSGWIENASYVSSHPVMDYSATFTVPSAPSKYASQLIYLFPGLVNTLGVTEIIQPVLQYGNNGAFGGKYWCLANWWVTANESLHTTCRKLTVGEAIRGRMVRTTSCSSAGCIWNISSYNTKNQTKLTLSVRTERTFDWIFAGVLEAYNVTACAQYPASYDKFYNFSIKDSTNTVVTGEDWVGVVETHPTTCGKKVVATTTQVNLYY